MSNKASKSRPVAPPAPAAQPVVVRSGSQWWWWALGLLVVSFIVFELYGPAIRSPFLFDDTYLPFLRPMFADAPLSAWMGSVRPLLMLGYWINYQTSQVDPYAYHVVNIVFHLFNGVLVALIVRRLLEWAFEPALGTTLALFSGLLFLVHPIQTESVTYVASRSETQSVFFFLAAFTVFVYRRRAAITLPVAAAVLILFACGVLSKEHTAVLVALLLLTDYYWNPPFSFSGIGKNWKLYVPIVLAAGAAGAVVVRVLGSADSAGFAMKDLPWYQYFFTQCRALWVYLRMFILPYGLNIDHDFAISRTILDGGAIVGLLALLAVAVAAWIWRRRFPLASYGYFAFLLLMAPTSSIVPIRDVLVERRLYLAFLPLLLIACEGIRQLKVSRTVLVPALGVIVAVMAFATYSRNQVWSDALTLWQDTVAKSPQKARPHFQLAYALYTNGQCVEAVRHYERVAQLQKPDYSLYVDWGLALECSQRPDDALRLFNQALTLEKTAHVYSLIALAHIRRSEREQAFAALDAAEKLDRRFVVTYIYRGNLLLLNGEFEKASEQFNRALRINPGDMSARNGLDMAQRRVVPTVK